MKFIINADDFGRTHERNIAIEWAFKERLITQASLMVNTPFSDEAIEIIRKNNYFDKVCLHINLACGAPLTDEMKKNTIYCFNGEFVNKSSFFRRNMHFHFFVLYKELKAQILKYMNTGGKMKHIDSHLYYHLDFPVMLVLIPLMIRYGFKTIRPVGQHFLERGRWKGKIYYHTINAIYKLFFKAVNWTSNIDYYIMRNPNLNKLSIIELYCHPDIKNYKEENYYFDNSCSLFGNDMKRLDENIQQVSFIIAKGSYNDL